MKKTPYWILPTTVQEAECRKNRINLSTQSISLCMRDITHNDVSYFISFKVFFAIVITFVSCITWFL